LFNESSERSNLRRIESFIASSTVEELCMPFRLFLNASGKTDTAAVRKEVSQTSARTFKIKKAYRTPLLFPVPYTEEESSVLYVSAEMTKRQYVPIRNKAKQRRCNIYPSYDVPEKESEACYQ
jgi:hypothetical protein